MCIIRMQCSEAFAILKVFCNRTVQDPSKQHLLELQEQFLKIPPDLLQDLQEYAMFPLELHLKQPHIGSEKKRYVVDCLKELVHCTKIKTVQLFYRLYSTVLFQIFDKDKTNMVATVPEELKLSVVTCTSELLKNASYDVIKQLYNKTNAPRFSQSIFICIQMMQREQLKQLRIAAVECVMVIAQVHDSAIPFDITQNGQVAETLMFVLPGILTGLLKVVTGDEKQGYFITLIALKAWCRILVLVMEDEETLKELLPKKFKFIAKIANTTAAPSEKLLNNNSNSPNREQLFEMLENQNRTPEWIADVAQKVAMHIESFIPLQQHSHWKVRFELAVSCCHILDKCLRNLKPATVTLLEILIKMSEDDNEKVASKSKEAIDLFAKKMEIECGVSLLEIVEENFYSLITKLPRILHATDDNEHLAALSLLAGYLKLLGPSKLPHVLNSASHLQRLVLALIDVVQLDNSGVSLLEDCSMKDFDEKKLIGLKRPWKQFKHFSHNDILQKVENICKLLGQFGDLDLLSDHLLDVFNKSSLHQKEAALLLNEILASGSSKENLECIVKNVLSIYLEPSTWYVPLSVGENDGECVSIGKAQSNLLLACLLVEGVGSMARALGPNFRPLLLRTLYPVLERAGSTHSLLATAGLLTAKDLADGADITSLLATNLDYFTFHMTVKLRKVEHNPGVLDVLSVAMKHSSLELLPGLQEIVANVLLQSCDTFQDHHALSFLQVFYTFFVSVRRWLGNKCDFKVEKSQEIFGLTPSQVVNNLLQYHKDKQLSECQTNIKSNEEVYMEDQSYQPKCNTEMELDTMNCNKKNARLPEYVGMTEAILKRCLHFLPSKDRTHQLMALQTLQEGVQLLAHWEDHLLPMVHLVWHPLVGRFALSDSLVLNHSFLLLCTLADLARDFIRSRTLKQVLPSLCQYLTYMAENSKKKDSGSAYRFTQNYKLQHVLLDKLGDLAIHLCLQEKELHQLLSVCVLYLSCLQPHPLQECCMHLFKKIAAYDPDAVWFHIRSLSSTTSYYCEFKKNGEAILQYVQDLVKTVHGV